MKAIVGLVLGLAACGTEPAAKAVLPPAHYATLPDLAPQDPRYLVVVGGDYATSVVSFVDLATVPTADSAAQPVVFSQALHSGSHVSQVATALSGDVVVAQTRLPMRQAVLIDRASGVLTVIAAASGQVVRQIKTSAATANGNPQDALLAPDGKLWVSRMAFHTLAADGIGRGDDVLSLVDGTINQRIDVHSYATVPGFIAAPQRMVLSAGRIWMPLGSFAPDFKDQGPARLLSIDPATSAIEITDLAAYGNCLSVRAAAGGRIVVACSGPFSKPKQQVGLSALVVLSPDATQPSGWTVTAEPAASSDGVWGRDFAVHGDVVFAVTLGDLASGRPDRLWQVNVAKHTRVELAKSLKPFAFSGMWLDAARNTLWLGDRSGAPADLRRWRVAPDGTTSEGKGVQSNPGGLAAIDLGAT